MHEIILNLHIHTRYSDGSLTHREVAQAAIRSNLDAIIITDHNVLVEGPEGYYHEGEKKVLVLIGEEIHDQARQPPKSHLLVFGIDKELASFAYDPQLLIQKVNQFRGICFLAHPYDPALPAFGEDNISWENWEVTDYTGIELWNGFSELKVRSQSKLQVIAYAFFPKFIAHQPPVETLDIWDNLLKKGQKVVAVGGSDSHANHYHMGPIHKTIFPYEFHFRGINTHILTEEALSGNSEKDSRSILDAMRKGHAFVGYDLPASTRGFQFWAENAKDIYLMGDEIKCQNHIKLRIHLPANAECRLIRNGKIISVWVNQTDLEFPVKEAGVYRVECYQRYLWKKRGWIYSNPIYVR